MSINCLKQFDVCLLVFFSIGFGTSKYTMSSSFQVLADNGLNADSTVLRVLCDNFIAGQIVADNNVLKSPFSHYNYNEIPQIILF